MATLIKRVFKNDLVPSITSKKVHKKIIGWLHITRVQISRDQIFFASLILFQDKLNDIGSITYIIELMNHETYQKVFSLIQFIARWSEYWLN